MGRPRQHGEQTRTALLAAAAELLHVEGRSAVSVRRVADAVGTSTRAVYSVFGDKEGLLNALSTEIAEIMRRHHEEVPERDDPVAEIIDLAFAYRAAALEWPNLYGVYVDEVRANARLDEPLFALVYRSFERVLRAIRRALADGRFPGRDEFDVGRHLYALVHGLASLELRGILGDDASARRIWRLSLEATLAGLQQPLAAADPRAERANRSSRASRRKRSTVDKSVRLDDPASNPINEEEVEGAQDGLQRGRR